VTDPETTNINASSPTSQFPNELPLVPLREAVVFPKLVVPLGVGREKSVAAINAAMNEEKHYIILAAQKDAEVDDVTPEQIYSVGTVAEIVRLLRIPDGSAQIIVQGINRVRITNYLPEQRFFRVNFDVIPDEIGNPVEREALLRSVRGLFEKYVDNGGSILPELACQRCPVPAIRFSGVEFPFEGCAVRSVVSCDCVDGLVLRDLVP